MAALEVYKFPPLPFVAFEHTISDPMSISYASNGAPQGSQMEPNRRVVSAVVPAVVDDAHGLITALQVMLLGKPPLVRLDLLPMHWLGANARRDGLGTIALDWTHSGYPLGWSYGGSPVTWAFGEEITGTAGDDNWPYLDCTGIVSGTVIVPGEAVAVGSAVAYVTRRVVSTGETTRVYLTSALASGSVTIGQKETRDFLIQGWPRSLQTLEMYTYSFELYEVFSTDYADGFTHLNPWQNT